MARYLILTSFSALLLCFCSCATKDRHNVMLVSVKEQKMALYNKGKRVATYPVSTSKFGTGDRPGSNRTPVGEMEVARKIGGEQPLGMVFKGRRPTGEVLPPNAPGRDPIVSRILWLRGRESTTRNAFQRYIYIHGTPEEKQIGKPASYGCIRMRSQDIADLYRRIGVGATVEVMLNGLPSQPVDRMKQVASMLGGAVYNVGGVVYKVAKLGIQPGDESKS